MPVAVASPWRHRRRSIFQSVFQTDVSQPTPQSTPYSAFPDPGQPFGGHFDAAPSYSGLPNEYRAGHSARSGPLFSQTGTTLPQGYMQLPTATATATATDLSSFQSTVAAPSRSDLHQSPPLFPTLAAAGNDQVAYDRAWHAVTAHIVLPPSATADDSFGTLPPDSQLQTGSQQGPGPNQEFYRALALVIHAKTLLPRATHTDDIIAWHAQQIRAHFSQHVIPLLSGCVDDEGHGSGGGGGSTDAERGPTRDRERRKRGARYERHMVTVMSSIRTLEAALRLYSYGVDLLARGFGRLADGSETGQMAAEAEFLGIRFRRDIHALVGNSASEELMKSIRFVLTRLAGDVLGIRSSDDGDAGSGSSPRVRPSPPTDDDPRARAARERLHELVEQLHNVGLAGERFQVLFAEIMDSMMSKFVLEAYAGVWTSPTHDSRSVSGTTNTISRGLGSSSTSPCIVALGDWVENHFARLSFEVLSRVSTNSSSSPVTLSDVKTYQSLALGRLAALRIAELFDIALAWPSSRSALEDLRVTITTTARRLQLTSSLSRTLQTRLLHPGCSTLEILRTYIAIIRTLHALDNSKVLLGHIEANLQLYLCQREDAVRVVVTGLLASPDEIKAARKVEEVRSRQQREAAARKGDEAGSGPFMTPAISGKPGTKATSSVRRDRGSTPRSAVREVVDASGDPTEVRVLSPPSTLAELALLLNDPSQTRRIAPEDEELDWDDMGWVPDPVDAGANYKRPKSEDVIGTLISALGSEDIFIKEFSVVVAGRLLGESARFDQEMRVLDLLKRRFGEAALQNCDVMIRDIQESRRVDAAIRRARAGSRAVETPVRTPAARGDDAGPEGDSPHYQARILSRLFWPDLEREHFMLPGPIVEYQKWYEQGYETLKSKRKLTWLNQLGQARVELELQDRTVTVDCSTLQATVIHAFQDADEAGGSGPVRRSAEELYRELEMDEDAIAEALVFWSGKGVLKRAAQGVYIVVETLSTSAAGSAGVADANDATANPSGEMADDGEEAGEAAESPRKQDGKSGLSAKETERRAMYWQYIKGMLTNASASMPLAQVSMMMKMLVPDGFPWSGEELQDFLGEKVAVGELEVIGGKYRLVKK